MACPNTELLAALAEGRLTPVERDALLEHLASCDDCRQTLLVLGSLNPAARIRPVPRRWIPWAAAAAIVTVTVIGFFLIETDSNLKTAARVLPKKEEVRPEPVPAPPVQVGAPEPEKAELSPRKDFTLP